MIEKLKQILDRMQGNKAFFFLPLIVIVLLVLVAIWGLFSNTRSGGIMMYGISAPKYATYESSTQVAYDSYNRMPPNANGGYVSVPAVDRKIIKNASVDMLVKKVEDTATKIQEIAGKYDGIVDGSDISNGGGDTKYGTLVIRVPNDKFSSAIEDIKELAVKVNSEVISSDDVTAQYVDMDARLRSKKAVEDQYVALLQKAKTVDEIVTVHSYLDKIREEIEVLQTQINYLSGQVAMSSITVSMTSESEVQIFGITWRPLVVVKQSFRNLLTDLTGIVDWLISFVFALPGILIKLALFIGVLWLVIKIGKRLYTRFI